MRARHVLGNAAVVLMLVIALISSQPRALMSQDGPHCGGDVRPVCAEVEHCYFVFWFWYCSSYEEYWDLNLDG